ncbi:MAG: hypothetical protein OQK24_10790, partial [Magnetovibrio sp.]|nr:hypothetical protein [Magnetovibrio sp.]
DVNPDADAPTLTAEAASGSEDTAIDLNISTGVTDTDGSESISSVVISGVPSGAELSAGTDNGNGTWTFDDPADLDGLTITPADNYNGTFNLSVTTNVVDEATGLPSDSSSATTLIGVTVAPVGDTPGISIVGSGSGDEDTNIPVGITVTPVGDEVVTEVTITGVPDGATLSLGTDNGGGSWTISGDDLDSLGDLSMTPELHYSGTPTFSITATTDEGGTVSVDAPINVNAVADTPNLSLEIGEGVEGTTGEPEDVTITKDNATDTDSGFTVTGRTVDANGNLSEASADNISDNSSPLGFGVSGGAATGAETELGYYDDDTSEQLVVDFDQEVTSVDVSFAWMHSGETAQYEIYSDGVKVGEGTVDGITDQIDPAVQLTADNGVAFDQIVFSAPDDGDDYLIHSIEFEAVQGGDTVTEYPVDITTSLVDTDGSETLSLVVSGVPSGASLSAGTDNGDGSWTVPTDSLDGLTLSVPDSVTEDFSLTATATATEPNGDTASVSVSDTVEMPDAPEPTVTINGTASGDEDTVIELDISATNAESVTISGLPTGASLSAGTDNGDGSWTFDDPADLDGLTMTPGEHYSGTTDLTVTATNSLGVTDSSTGSVEVVGVADAPNLTVELGEGVTVESSGETPEAETVFSSDFDAFNGFVQTADGFSTNSDAIEVWQSTNGHTGDGSFIELNDDLCDVYDDAVSIDRDFDTVEGHTYTLTFDYSPRAGYDENVNSMDIKIDGVVVDSLAPDGSNNSDNEWQTHTITFEGTGEPMNLEFLSTGVAQAYGRGIRLDNIEMEQTAPAETETTTTYDLDITSSLVDTDGSETLSITVGGIPDGASLTAGTDNGDGTWTLSANDLDGLQVEVTGDVSADFDLSVTATATEANGDTSSVNQTVTVDVPEGVPDPTVSIDATKSGDEDTAIPLGITVANAATVTIAGVPSGATLSAGTDNGDGSWTLTAAQVDGVTLTGDQDYSGTFDLSVTATNSEGATASTTTSVEVVGVADAPTLSTTIGDAVVSDGDSSTDYDVDDFGAGAGANAGSDEKEDDLSKYDDEWTGDSSNNDVDGEKGDDVLAGKGGADDIEGGKGDDLIFGGAGDDNLEGDSGNDIIFGGSGNNAIKGGSGDDFIISGDGDDDIHGGSGDDVIYAGGGMNEVDGSSGTDTMVFTGYREEYLFTDMGNDTYVVEHLNGGADGVNLVDDVEIFQFMDGQFDLDDMEDSNPNTDDTTVTYDIDIDTGLSDTDGSETLSDVTVSGIPDGATFSAGTDNGDGSWTMTSNDLNDLTLTVDSSVSDDFSMTISVTSTEANGDAATSTSELDVALPDGFGSDDGGDGGSSIVGDTSADALDPLAAMFEDNDTLTFDGQEYDISSLTDGDTTDNYGGAAPIGKKAENEDYDPADNDTGDGYSSSDDGTGGSGPDIE